MEALPNIFGQVGTLYHVRKHKAGGPIHAAMPSAALPGTFGSGGMAPATSHIQGFGKRAGFEIAGGNRAAEAVKPYFFALSSKPQDGQVRVRSAALQRARPHLRLDGPLTSAVSASEQR